MGSVRAAAPHLKLYEEERSRLPNGRIYAGIDSESLPAKQNILAMLRSPSARAPGLREPHSSMGGRNVSVAHTGDAAEEQTE